MSLRSSPVIDLCFISIFTAIIAIMAQIVIPMPYGVPMTLQTLAISLAGILLGPRRGAISALLYVLLGAVGVPVFAGLNGGLGAVFGPTGGFIMSFPVLAFAAGFGAARNSAKWLYGGIVVGIVFNYICGVVYFSIITSNDLITSFITCVLVFIPTDILKIITAGLIGKKVRMLNLTGSVI